MFSYLSVSLFYSLCFSLSLCHFLSVPFSFHSVSLSLCFPYLSLSLFTISLSLTLSLFLSLSNLIWKLYYNIDCSWVGCYLPFFVFAVGVNPIKAGKYRPRGSAGDERKVDEDHRQDQQTSEDRTDEQSPRLINKKKEMFYLTTHSTHFILRFYGVGHMVKDHSDSERGNPLPPHGLLLPISRKGSFICIIPKTE